MKVKCPTCKKEVVWNNNPNRPFCSERCKLIDLGAWADGSNSVPTDPSPSSEEDVPQKPAPENDPED